MWPFRKSKNDENLLISHQKKFPIGKKFNYLGVKMTVVDNIEVGFGMAQTFLQPYVKAHYVDSNNVIRSISLYNFELLLND